MSKKLNLESLMKKLKNVANTQDSIPMFSLWIIHHKANYNLIVNTWLEILKTSDPKHRLTLLYLANDVIQCCKRKKAEIFREAFASVLPEAISFLRDPSISPGVVRVLNVWMQRKVYDTELIDQLHAALLTNRPPDTLRQKLLAEYKPTVLIDEITAFKKNEDVLIVEEKQLKNIHVDASSSDDIHKLKDKVGGERFSRNFEESATNIEHFIVQYEKFVEERKALIDDLSQGAVFYRAQYHEAKIVVNAYQSFDARVSKMKKLLDQVKMKYSPKTPTINPVVETNFADDMDMSDSDQELGSKPSKIVAVDTNANRPVLAKTTSMTVPTTSKVSQPTQQTGTFVNRPGMRGASTSTLFSTPSPKKAPSANINIPVSFNGGMLSTSFGSKVSTPSASPPSPEGSPELNIASPPRYPSLESRLADIFSTGAKPNMGSTTENTASESDTDSISNMIQKPASPPDGTSSAKESASETPSTPKNVTSASSAADNDTQSSWQNTIPVIGGNRHSTPSQSRSFLENLAALDGGSTPLQDEMGSEGENFRNEKTNTNGPKSTDHALPPPSFSGDALHFLTKFMGQKTNTSLAQGTTSQEPTTPINPLQNLSIDWNSIQNITASVSNWPANTSGYNAATTQHATATMPAISKEQDTDYRTTTKSFQLRPTVTSEQTVTTNAADQFRDILRRKSSEQPPTFAPSSEEVIVEEEEILVEDDGQIEHNPHQQQQQHDNGHNQSNKQVHLNNLTKIPTFSDNLSPPTAPPKNLLQMAGQKRPLQDEDFRMRNEFPPPHFPRTPQEPMHRQPFRPMSSPRMPPRPRMPVNHQSPFRASFRARVPPPRPFRQRPPMPRRNSSGNYGFAAEDDYYDMLYDELRPKFPRPNMGPRGQFRPRRPFR